jgi:hypothetical protein
MDLHWSVLCNVAGWTFTSLMFIGIQAQAQTPTKVGVYRNGTSFLLDSNGNGTYDPILDRFTDFGGSLPGGAKAGDAGVAGDWTGDGKSKVGVYRNSTGQWFLDTNNNGVFDAGDSTFAYGGLASDIPVVGDWQGLGRSCVGIFRQGFFWILDWNCNGGFDAADATFPFGGLPGDVPVVGAWVGLTTRVGVVRKYAPGGVPQGPPFFWVLDSAIVASGSGTAATHQPSFTGNTAPFPFGGVPSGVDIFVTGDWLGNGFSRAGIYRQGSWILDLQGNHTYDTFFQFGGLATDTPVTGKW